MTFQLGGDPSSSGDGAERHVPPYSTVVGGPRDEGAEGKKRLEKALGGELAE